MAANYLDAWLTWRLRQKVRALSAMGDAILRPFCTIFYIFTQHDLLSAIFLSHMKDTSCPPVYCLETVSCSTLTCKKKQPHTEWDCHWWTVNYIEYGYMCGHESSSPDVQSTSVAKIPKNSSSEGASCIASIWPLSWTSRIWVVELILCKRTTKKQYCTHM